MYEKRLLKFVKAHSGLFTAPQIASMWKRHQVDVGFAAFDLWQASQIKINEKGILYAI